MKKQNLTQKALEFATKKHEGQFRKDGKIPYVTHPIRVAEIVKKYKKSHKIKELIAAAYLHDTLEDTDTGIFELQKEFGSLVTLLVIQLTNDENKKELQGKIKYHSQRLSNEKHVSSWALVIKLADRLDNVSDLSEFNEKEKQKRITETREILATIETKRNLSGTHKRLIKAIREMLDSRPHETN